MSNLFEFKKIEIDNDDFAQVLAGNRTALILPIEEIEVSSFVELRGWNLSDLRTGEMVFICDVLKGKDSTYLNENLMMICFRKMTEIPQSMGRSIGAIVREHRKLEALYMQLKDTRMEAMTA